MVEGSPAEKYLFTPENINEFVNKIEGLISQSGMASWMLR
jgi:hypothetical protein